MEPVQRIADFTKEHTLFANFHFSVTAAIDIPPTRSYGIIYPVTCLE